MKILIVSGFLGAGKTTFIKELIRRTKSNPVILENEYGENDLDSRALKGDGKLEILEFMEGCVCCTKKDSFVNTILSISAAMDPEYLVVEPSGVGKLGSILESVKKIEYDRITLLPPIVILPPRSITENLRNYPDIYEDQILSTHQILFSKAEHEAKEILDEAEKKILEINPNASVLKTHYTNQPDDWWNSLLQNSGETIKLSEGNKIPQKSLEPQQLSLHKVSVSSPGELMQLLEDVLHGIFGSIPRAKGVIPAGNEFLRFDVADGLYGIIRDPDPSPRTQCVFIGNNMKVEKLLARLHTNQADEGITRHEKRKSPFVTAPIKRSSDNKGQIDPEKIKIFI